MEYHTGQDSQPIVLHMKSWRERNCWARWPRLASDRRSWHGGTSGHCATWYCRTPWGAVWGARKLHQLTARKAAWSKIPARIGPLAGNPSGTHRGVTEENAARERRDRKI